MAQFFDDFGDPYTTGSTLATDTSDAWVVLKSSANYGYTIQDLTGATDGRVLQCDYSSGGAQFSSVTWETPGGETGSIEVVGRFRLAASSSEGFTDLMMGPQLFAADYGGFGWRRAGSNSFRLTRWSTGGTVAASIAAAVTFSDVAAETWVWVRVGRVAGSPDTVRGKIWLDSDGEPEAWTSSGTSSTYQGTALKAGIGTSQSGRHYAVDPLQYDVVGVGTGTDEAPKSGSSSNNAPTFDGEISDLSGTEGAAITPVDVSGEFADADDDPLTFSQVGTWPARSGGGSWVSSAGVISGTPASGSAGTYTALQVRASDGIDTVDSDEFEFEVASGGSAPTLDSVTYPLRHGSAATFSGTNLSGATLTLTYSTVDVAQTVTTTATAITVAAVNSSTLPYGTITVTASTEGGDAVISVTHLPPVTRDYVVADVPWDAGSESILEGGSVEDGDQLDFEILTSLDVTALVRDDGTLRVDSDTGLHTFRVRIWDESALEWGALTTITVYPAGYDPGYPTWIGPNISDAALTVGDAYSLDVSALFQDVEDDIETYTLVGSWPSWFAWSESTGIGSGVATVGTWSALQVRATDSTAQTGLSNLFSITVSAAARSAATYIDRIAWRPGVVRAVGEGSVLVYTVTCLSNGAVVTPESLRYRVEDDTGSEVLGWTDATVGASTTVVIGASYQQMRSENSSTEWRTVTVEADHGTDYAYSDSIRYKLVNQFGI